MKLFWISLAVVIYIISIYSQPVNSSLDNSLRNLDDRNLSKLESKLYQGQDFSRDPISLRIERLEIALFGEISKDLDLSSRLINIEERIALLELNLRQENLKEKYPENRIKRNWDEEEQIRLRNKLDREQQEKREARRQRYRSVSPFLRTAFYRLINLN